MYNWQGLLLAGVAVISSGCSSLGPRYIESSRASYLDVLALTDQQELLANLVRMRYAEAPVFMQIDGITASPSLRFDVDTELDVDSFVDNSVLKPRVTYEDNPTVVYTPLLGKEFARELLVPLDPVIMILLHENGWQLDELFQLLVSSINGIRNGPTDSVRFDAIADVFGELSQSGGLIIGTTAHSDSMGGEPLSLWLSNSAKASRTGQALIAELALDSSAEAYVIKPGFRSGDAAVTITMRPLYAVMLQLAAMIDVPADHSSRGRPDDALVTVRSRNVWFSVADSDLRSKRTLQTLRLLFNLQAQKGGGTAFQLSLPVR